jgi:hypothetical protein
MTNTMPHRARVKDVGMLFARVNAAALPRLESLCRDWTHRGRKSGMEYVALNPTRADTRLGSFRINLQSGRWADFATGDAGGDPVSLYAYLHNMRQIEAAKSLGHILGVQP